MKQNYLMKTFILFSILICSYECISQSSSTDYRRSSLTMVLIENSGLGKSKEMVTNSYYSNPFPDKYNKHEIADNVFNPDALKLTTSDYLKAGFYKDTLKTLKDFLGAAKKPLNKLRYVTADSSKAVQEPTKEELLNIYIQKYIDEKKLAKQVVATWFDRKPDGKMSWDVISKRGMYSASAEKLENSKKMADSTSFLQDFELIGNTYTAFNKMDFYANEPVARLIRDLAKTETVKALAGKPDVLLTKALEGIDAVYEKTKEGYTVLCYTYLYQLDWNDTIAQKTKAMFFNDNVTFDKVEAWDTTTLFKMKFIGRTLTTSIVTFKIGEKRTEEQIIDLQVRRTMDNALTKLQKTYVQFRPVAPISSIAPLTAKIGLKEGVEPKQQYEILKLKEDAMGISKLERVEVVSVPKKNPIWDNRQGADQEPLLDEEGKPIVTPEFTTFSGGKNAKETYYIRLVK